MVNRYITALLVVLAATGMEAQTYQQALKFALTDISKALEEDILCVLKAIKAASEDESIATHHPILSATLVANSSDILTDIHSHIYYDSPTEHRYKVPYGSIVIRGPDC